MTCRECGEAIPYKVQEDICNECCRKAARVDEVRYAIAVLEKAVMAAQCRDLRGLKCALRDARHVIEDMEKALR